MLKVLVLCGVIFILGVICGNKKLRRSVGFSD